jgi:hypothetical protein
MMEIFNEVTKIVADPHKTILTHDKVRAAKILIEVYSFLSNQFNISEDYSAIVFEEDLKELTNQIPEEIIDLINKEQQ